MALKALVQVERATPLDAAEVVAQIGPAVLAPSKGSATQALGLLERAVASEPDLRPRAASLVAEALGHGSADVQKVALEKLHRVVPDATRGSRRSRSVTRPRLSSVGALRDRLLARSCEHLCRGAVTEARIVAAGCEALHH